MTARTIRTRWFLGIMLPLVLLLLLIALDRQRRERMRWHPLAVGRLATLDVERAFYRSPGSDRFYMRVRITNSGTRPLGVALNDAVYPLSIFEGSASTRFQLQGARPASPVSGPDFRRLSKLVLQRYRAGQLISVPAGKSMSYFWQYSRPWSAARQKSGLPPFTLVFMGSGEVPVTDGQKVEALSSMKWTNPADGVLTSNLMVLIPNPVPWKELPANARVLNASRK